MRVEPYEVMIHDEKIEMRIARLNVIDSSSPKVLSVSSAFQNTGGVPDRAVGAFELDESLNNTAKS